MNVETIQASASPEQTEALKALYSAINRNDIRALLPLLHPEIERTEPEGFPSSGTYHGIVEFETHVWKARETWAEGGCEPERFLAAGERVVVYVHVRVKLKEGGKWVEGRIADGFVFRDGKIKEMRTFVERSAALAWAGIASD